MKKLSKKLLLASLGFAAATITVPVVLTSCGQPDDKNDPINADITIAKSFSYVGSINDLFDGSGTPNTTVAEILTKKMNDDKKSVITNYDQLSESLKQKAKIEITPTTPEKWQGDSDWTIPTDVNKNIYYDITSEQLNISSLGDLQSKLNEDFLTKAFKTALNLPEENTNTYKLTEGAKLKFDKDNNYINVSVDEVNSSNPTLREGNNTYNLMIPTSDLNVVLNDVNIKVSGEGINEKTDKINLTFDVGVESTPKTDDVNKTIDLKLENITVENVIKNLGWYDSTSTELKLDSEKIGDAIKVFNTTFTNQQLELVNKDTKTYNLVFDATPNSGYSWSDTKDQSVKQIKVEGLTISGVNPEDKKDAKASADVQQYQELLEIKGSDSKETIKTYFSDANNLKGIETYLNNVKDGQDANLFANVDFAFVDVIEKEANNAQSNYKITLNATPKNGHLFENGSKDPILVTVELTNIHYLDAKIESSANYDTPIDFVANDKVENIEVLKTYLEKDSNKNANAIGTAILTLLKDEAHKDNNAYIASLDYVAGYLEKVTTTTTKVDTTYSIKFTAKAEAGHYFENGKETSEITVNLTVKWAQLGASVTDKPINKTATDLGITDTLFNTKKPDKTTFENDWFNSNKTKIEEIIKNEGNIKNADITNTVVKSVTNDTTVVESTLTATGDYVFADGQKTATVTFNISGIKWVENTIAIPSPIDYTTNTQVHFNSNETANTQLDAKMKKADDPNLEQITNLIKTTINNLKTVTYKSGSAATTVTGQKEVGKATASVKFTVTTEDTYSFTDYEKTKEVTVNLTDVDVKKTDASIDEPTIAKPYNYNTTIDLSTNVENKDTLTTYLEDENNIAPIIQYLKDNANPVNISDNGYKFKSVAKNDKNEYVATFTITPEAYHLFSDYTDSKEITVTLTNIKWLDTSAKVDTIFSYDDLVQLDGTADTDVTKDQFNTWLQTEANKTKLISDIQTTMLDAIKGKGKFSNLTITFVSGPKEVTGTTKFTIVVEATANKGFAFGAADKTTETITVTLTNVKNPVTSNPTP